ncbi:MAG: CBS domain-containing protein [FCB group bacterium]|nr:CBS domain-containing protein [FCB group bacterium]
MMQIKDMLKSKRAPITIHEDQTMENAMKLLIDNKIGALIMVDDDDNPIGIITERDIFHLAFRFRGDMMDIMVKDHMVSNLVVSTPEDDIEHIAEVMIQKRIRHVPVVDDSKKLIGILSIRDVVKAKLVHPVLDKK